MKKMNIKCKAVVIRNYVRKNDTWLRTIKVAVLLFMIALAFIKLTGSTAIASAKYAVAIDDIDYYNESTMKTDVWTKQIEKDYQTIKSLEESDARVFIKMPGILKLLFLVILVYVDIIVIEWTLAGIIVFLNFIFFRILKFKQKEDGKWYCSFFK